MAYTSQYAYNDPYLQIDPETGLPIEPYAPYMSAPAPATRPRGAVDGITNQSNPIKAAEQDRIFAYNRGSELDQENNNFQDEAKFERGAFQDKLKGVYDPLIAGQGGLSPSQLNNVTREGELANLQLTPEEEAAAQFSDDERLAVMGNTNNRRKYFNPNYENDIFNEGSARERGAVDAYGQALGESYDPATLRPGAGFATSLNGGVDEYGRTIESALDPAALTVSDEFLKNYQFTPEQQQDAITAAATTVGTRDKAAIGELERRARAAGTNPLGVAAMRQRMERESSADAADAATAAKVGVNAEAARRLHVGEGMRIGANQNFAGMKTDAAGRKMDAGYRATTTGEQIRGAAERDIADRSFNAADRSGQARMGSESDLARRRLALQQNITQVGNEAERDVENADAERARYLAQQRTQGAQYVQGQKYGRGIGASDRLSDRYRYATDAGRQDAQEGRGYYATQGTQANQNYNTAADRRTNIYGTQAGAGQSATNTQARIEDAEKSRPKWYDKLLAAGSQAAAAYYGGGRAKGGVITEPTFALIGEDGPEMIVPLGAQNPEVLPSMAVRPGQPPPFATAPPPARLKAAYSQQYRYGS